MKNRLLSAQHLTAYARVLHMEDPGLFRRGWRISWAGMTGVLEQKKEL